VKTIRVWVAIVACTLIPASVMSAARGITIKGSDTMVILGQRWAEEYMNRHPGTVLQVTGGGGSQL
jgi:phosphate transport system substrate-binding protein